MSREKEGQEVSYSALPFSPETYNNQHTNLLDREGVGIRLSFSHNLTNNPSGIA
jgi:hypothetical protein